eukprot:5228111-Karenia_brevis.AAC.1
MEHSGRVPALPSKIPGLVCVTPIAMWAPPWSTAVVVPHLPSILPGVVCATLTVYWAPPWSTA